MHPSIDMHPHAHHAIIAAANWTRWGRMAALQYAKNRGVPVRLIGLARMLQRAQ